MDPGARDGRAQVRPDGSLVGAMKARELFALVEAYDWRNWEDWPRRTRGEVAMFVNGNSSLIGPGPRTASCGSVLVGARIMRHRSTSKPPKMAQRKPPERWWRKPLERKRIASGRRREGAECRTRESALRKSMVSSSRLEHDAEEIRRWIEKTLERRTKDIRHGLGNGPGTARGIVGRKACAT